MRDRSAIKMIYELGGRKRDVYAGAVGCFGFGGTIDTCIAIRTMVFREGRVVLRAGGGIVWDSVAGDEWEETVNKLGSNVAVIDQLEER
jgi:anthranilate synthase component 1